MRPILENCILDTDLDCAGFNLLNVGSFDPAPTSFVTNDDPRLFDTRQPNDGSVTDLSVAADAAIAQSKLDLTGDIPSAWLGTTSTTAAQGDLAEYVANKGQPNGYASLDSGGKIPTGQLPTGVGSGTVTSVALTMPTGFTVGGSPITTSGTLAVTWTAQADHTWFGNKSGGSAAPQFYTSALPVTLIPSLDAAQVTSGTFDVARLPAAVGIGASHAPGIVPDPGPTGGGALATDYLARDMSWRHAPTLGPSYQPTLPDITLSSSGNDTGPVTVMAMSTVPAVNFFASSTSNVTGFTEITTVDHSVSVDPGDDVWIYAASAGWNNSDVETYHNDNA